MKREQIYKYKHGLPFSEVLDTNIDAQKERINLNKASMIIIDGGQGEGKTTLAVHVAEYYQGKKINLKEQIALGGEDFQLKLRNALEKGYKVLIYDEAGDFASRNAMTSFNRMMNRVFETFRTYQILIIICLPSFQVLDKSLFNKQIPRLLLHCHSRGATYGDYHAYSLNKMYWILYYMQKYVVVSDAYKRQTPNFRGHFLPLPPIRQKELDKISTEAKISVLDKNVAMLNGWFTVRDMGKRTGFSNQKVRKTIKELGFEPTHKTNRNIWYYDITVLKAVIKELTT